MSDALPYQGKTALYFEDQPERVEAIKDLLHYKLGIELQMAVTLKEASKLVMERKFDLVILDIRIQADGPKEQSGTEDWARSGLHFLKELRDGKFGERTPKDVPVLVITCVVNTSDVDAILEIGNSPGARCLYIAKPTKLDPVVEAVHKLFA